MRSSRGTLRLAFSRVGDDGGVGVQWLVVDACEHECRSDGPAQNRQRPGPARRASTATRRPRQPQRNHPTRTPAPATGKSGSMISPNGVGSSHSATSRDSGLAFGLNLLLGVADLVLQFLVGPRGLVHHFSCQPSVGPRLVVRQSPPIALTCCPNRCIVAASPRYGVGSFASRSETVGDIGQGLELFSENHWINEVFAIEVIHSVLRHR